MSSEMNRRLYGLLSNRLDEARLDEVADGRDDRGKRWGLGALLRATRCAMRCAPWSPALCEHRCMPWCAKLNEEKRLSRASCLSVSRHPPCPSPHPSPLPSPGPIPQPGPRSRAVSSMDQDWALLGRR